MTAEIFLHQNRYSGKTYEVLGYSASGDCFCPDCAEEKFPEGVDPEGNELGVIFADTEFDRPVECGACHEEIPVSVCEDLPPPQYERFDVAMAWFTYLSANHTGQWDPAYARLSHLRTYFSPGPFWKGYWSMESNAKAIYRELEKRDAVNSDPVLRFQTPTRATVPIVGNLGPVDEQGQEIHDPFEVPARN